MPTSHLTRLFGPRKGHLWREKRRRSLRPAVDRMEGRSLAAPVFSINPFYFNYMHSYTEAMALGVGDNDQFWDFSLQNADTPFGYDFFFSDNNGNKTIEANEVGDMNSSLSGPNSGVAGDARPATSSQIQITATHHNQDIVSNYTQAPYDLSNFDTHLLTQADGSATYNVSAVGYLDIHFHAHFDATVVPSVDAAPTMSVQIFSNNVDNVDFTIDGGVGYLADQQGVGLIDVDTAFVSRGASDVDTHVLLTVDANSIIQANYQSELGSYTSGQYQPGVTTSDSHFNWTLTMTLS